MNQRARDRIFPERLVGELILEWRALHVGQKTLSTSRREYEVLERIAWLSTPMLIKLAEFERHPEPLKIAELCRESIPRWVQATEGTEGTEGTVRPGRNFSAFATCARGCMRPRVYGRRAP